LATLNNVRQKVEEFVKTKQIYCFILSPNVVPYGDCPTFYGGMKLLMLDDKTAATLPSAAL
jgi:hypothetical protein